MAGIKPHEMNGGTYMYSLAEGDFGGHLSFLALVRSLVMSTIERSVLIHTLLPLTFSLLHAEA